MKHVGDLIATLLMEYEVDYVFGMPGGQTTALHQGIDRLSPKIEHVLVRDERSAPYAADAYARLTGKPGVCDVTVGPGATKLTDGIVEAYNASIPMICIVGDLPLDWTTLRHKGVASQGFKQQAFLESISKAVFMVPSVTALPDVVRSAFRIATSPRPGPVCIIVPHDIMDAPWEDVGVVVDKRCVRAPSIRFRPEDAALQRAAELISRAKRPAIIAGGGVHASNAADLLTALCDRIQPLVVSSLSGKGSVPETRSYAAGVLNPLGSAAAIELIKDADLLIWCGSKASQNTAMNWTIPSTTQATITIDVDPEEHGRTFQPTVALCGDIRATLEVLAPLITAQPQSAWLARIAEVIAKKNLSLNKERSSMESPIAPPFVMAGIAKRMNSDDIVISDASFSAGWIAQHIPATESGRRFLYARGQGGLGYASPAAIGAASVQRTLGRGGRVVTVAGDGGHSFAIGELATLAQNRMRVVNVVLNNGILGWLQMWQELFFKDLRKSVDLNATPTSPPNFAAAGTAMGLLGIQVRRPEELDVALDAAFAHDGPSLVEVLIDPKATPIHSFRRRYADPNPREPVRPGTVYELREWKLAAEL